jgi:type 1 glutamine amidotransferase
MQLNHIYTPIKYVIVTALCILAFNANLFAKANPKVLIFFKEVGEYHHTVTPTAINAIIKLGEQNAFDVDTTTNAENFTEENLKQYSAVIFLNTEGDVLEDDQQEIFKSYINHGGGFVGIHSATDTEFEWNWYGRLVGAYYKNHPDVQAATLKVVDHTQLSTQALPAIWKRTDEWYNFGWYNDDIKFLVVIDEGSYGGGRNGGEHPISWYHAFDGGRAWYTAMGHTEETYSEPLFLKHLLGGIEYAMGKKANEQSNAR